MKDYYNHLKDETSPYLLQHAQNPVDWYAWGEEAFIKARNEDKPIFLSIGYSTCHWCHVMAHESFEDSEVADYLNRHFVCIKVDREERPDIDAIYMSVCEALTGAGGWPTSIFMSPEQKPFFAGTYFPKNNHFGYVGFLELLRAVHEKWVDKTERKLLLQGSETVISRIKTGGASSAFSNAAEDKKALIDSALAAFKRGFDESFGGFFDAPKFPAPHNLMFLLRCFQKGGDKNALFMTERTLERMYAGGLFDHMGGGFARYSTDRKFLVPHFEKMLYDNALLISCYCDAFAITKKPLYLDVARRTADFILSELTSDSGGFFSAKDADFHAAKSSDENANGNANGNAEGGFYTFTPDELIALLGSERGEAFNRRFDITERGNFEGRSIPNLLTSGTAPQEIDSLLPKVYEYRKRRGTLFTDEKILTAWNGLAIAALAKLFRVSGDEKYIIAAIRANQFIRQNLCENNTLFVSFAGGKRGNPGFLDDYAFYIYALLSLYEAGAGEENLNSAKELTKKVIDDFFDAKNGGFYLYGSTGEQLIARPKACFDGALPSGNSMMAYNLVRLSLLSPTKELETVKSKQLDFLTCEAQSYSAAHSFFLIALYESILPPGKVTAVMSANDNAMKTACRLRPDFAVNILEMPTQDYRLVNNETTFYVCDDFTCRQPSNSPDAAAFSQHNLQHDLLA